MAPPRLAGKDWPRIRHDYEETDKPNHAICAEHEISASTLRNRVRQWNWTPRRAPVPTQGPPLPEIEAPPIHEAPLVPAGPASAPPLGEPSPHFAVPPPAAPVDARQIAQRLQDAIARVLAAIDAALAGLSAASHAREIERTGRAVAGLTRTLHELNTLKADYPASAAADRGPDQPDEFILDLVRRMDAFAARHQASAAAAGSALPRELSATPNPPA